NAPGVVATSGPISDQKITLNETGNVGVFGQGGDQVDDIRNDTPQGAQRRDDFTVGPGFAGAGVVGRGGGHMKNSEANGQGFARPKDAKGIVIPGGSAGVVGIAGGSTMPEASTYFNAGVFGQSTTGSGVSGLSTSGAGVSGASTNNAGVAGINLASNPTASAP